MSELLASGEPQVYGTQLIARDGRFVARLLRDPDTVDERRAAAGLEPLQASLDDALERYGPPSPMAVQCRHCQNQIEIWLPETGERIRVECAACGSVMAVRLRYGTARAEPNR